MSRLKGLLRRAEGKESPHRKRERERERERELKSEADKKSVAKRRKEERNVCERVLWGIRWRRAKGCGNGFQRRNNANAEKEGERERSGRN